MTRNDISQGIRECFEPDVSFTTRKALNKLRMLGGFAGMTRARVYACLHKQWLRGRVRRVRCGEKESWELVETTGTSR